MIKIFLTIVLLFPLLPSVSFSGGEEITVIDTGGKMVRGELLSHRPDEIILSMQSGAGKERLKNHPELLLCIPKGNIAYVEKYGHSHTGVGIGFGVFVGLVAGAAIGSSSVDKRSDFLGLEQLTNTIQGEIIGILLGATAGGIIGDATSSSDKRIDGSNNFVELNGLARYQGNEPDYLRMIK